MRTKRDIERLEKNKPSQLLTPETFAQDQKAQGFSAEEAFNNFQKANQAGLINNKPIKVSGNRKRKKNNNLYSSLREDPWDGIPPTSKAHWNNLTTRNDRARKLLADFYSNKFERPIDRNTVDAIIADRFPGLSPVDAFKQEATVGEYIIGKGGYNHYEVRNPYEYSKDGLKFFANDLANIGLDTASGLIRLSDKVGNMLARVNPIAQIKAGKLRGEERAKFLDDFEFLRGNNAIRDMMLKGLQQEKESTYEFYVQNIPSYVKEDTDFFSQRNVSGLFSEAFAIPLSANPLTAIGSIGGRLYNEAYEEAIAEGKTEEQAHNIALGYTTTFGSINYVLDKFTLGLGSKVPKKLLANTSDRTKIFASVAERASKAGVGEFFNEGTQSIMLQAATKSEDGDIFAFDKVNYKQATVEGAMGAIVGTMGGGSFGAINIADAKKVRKDMIEAGYDEDVINAAFLYNSTNDPEGMEDFLYQKLESDLANIGEELDLQLNYQSYATDQRNGLAPKSIADFREIGKFGETDLKKLAREAQIPAQLVDAFIVASRNPNERSVAEYNKKLEKYQLERQEETGEAPYVPYSEQPTTQKRIIEKEIQITDVLRKSTDDPAFSKRLEKLQGKLQFDLQKIIDENPDIEDDVNIPADIESDDIDIEYNVDDQVIYEGETTTVKSKSEVIVNGERQILYTLANGKQVNPEISPLVSVDQPVSSPIELDVPMYVDPAIEMGINLEIMEHQDIVDMTAGYIANDAKIPDVLLDEAEKRYSGIPDVFKASVLKQVDLIKRKIKADKKSKEMQAVNNTEQALNANLVFEFAVKSTENGVRALPREYWLAIADNFIAEAQREKRRKGEPPGEFDREYLATMLRGENSASRGKMVREIMQPLVQSGNVEAVINELNKGVGGKKAFNPDHAPYKAFVRATELMRDARHEQQAKVQKPIKTQEMINETESEIEPVVQPEVIEEVIDNDIVATIENYEDMSFKELRALGQERGVSARSKKDFVERLTALDNKPKKDSEAILQERVLDRFSDEEVNEINSAIRAKTGQFADELNDGELESIMAGDEGDIDAEEIMKILAVEQGYTGVENEEDISIEDLPPAFRDWFEGTWLPWAEDIGNKLEELSDNEDISFEYQKFIGKYFPLRRDVPKGMDYQDGTLTDLLIGAGSAVASRRQGVYSNLIGDPITQLFGNGGVGGYLQDIATIFTIAEAIQEAQSIILEGNTENDTDGLKQTAEEVKKYNELPVGEEKDKAFTPKVKAYQDIQELNKRGESRGIQSSGYADPVLIDLINLDGTNELSQDLKESSELMKKMLFAFKGKSDENKVTKFLDDNGFLMFDPVPIVSYADGADTENLSIDPNATDEQYNKVMYKANSELFHMMMQQVANAQRATRKLLRERALLLKPYGFNKTLASPEKMNRLSGILNEVFIKNKNFKQFMYQENPEEIEPVLKYFNDVDKARKPKDRLNLTKQDAKVLLWHRNAINAVKAKMALSNDVMSDTSLLDIKIRKRFHEIERMIVDGSLQNEPKDIQDKILKEYMSFDPEGSILDEDQYYRSKGFNPETASNKSIKKWKKKYKIYKEDINTSKLSFKSMKARRLARYLFESTAINNNNFDAWFESTVQISNHGDYFNKMFHLANRWADYQDQQGRPLIAKFWRVRANNHIKGDLFEWENILIDNIATLSKTDINDPEAKADIFNESSIDKLRKDMITVQKKIQQFNIVKNLLGNLGWITTQVSSYNNVAAKIVPDVGIIKALKLSGQGIFFKDEELKELAKLSVTGDIKSARIGAEKAGFFEDISIYAGDVNKKTKRRRIRQLASLIPSYIEEYITRGSFVAGALAGKQIGLTESQQNIHGDFIAATTQTMYDGITRNSALNVQSLKTLSPFQSYSLTMWSNLQQFLGNTGVATTKQKKIKQLIAFLAVGSVFWRMISMLFAGDDLKKALFNPTINKFTVGSMIPYFGKSIDIKISEMLPWVDDLTWQKDSYWEQAFKKLGGVAKDYIDDKPNANQNAIKWANSYIAPIIGIPGSVMINNGLRMFLATEYDDYEFRDVNGKKYAEFYNPNIINYAKGTLFGIKAVDTPERIKRLEAE